MHCRGYPKGKLLPFHIEASFPAVPYFSQLVDPVPLHLPHHSSTCIPIPSLQPERTPASIQPWPPS